MRRNILITGSNRGLGLEAVKQLSICKNNYVFASCRYPERAQDLQKLKVKCDNVEIFPLDLEGRTSIKKLISLIDGRTIDILINIAGIFGPNKTPLGSLNIDEWLKVFQVNTIGPIKLIEALLPNIQNGEKKIVINFSSIMGSITLGNNQHYVYSSSKAALNLCTKLLAENLAQKKITVVAIHPGWVKTDMGGNLAPLLPKQSIAGVCDIIQSLSLSDSGKFIDYQGQVIPW
jgi:NAD(P)-dependent dehydrogenase (short-subunit alcohol dehydrogenase family)